MLRSPLGPSSSSSSLARPLVLIRKQAASPGKCTLDPRRCARAWRCSRGEGSPVRVGRADEVPEIQRVPFILDFYRLQRPRLEHFHSWHNEAANMWTHVVALLAVLAYFTQWLAQESLGFAVLDAKRKGYFARIAALFVVAICLFTASIMYHWKRCGSDEELMCWLCVDQNCIAAVIAVGYFVGIPMGFHCDPSLVMWYSLWSLAVLGALVASTRHLSANSYWKMAALALCGLLAYVPFLHWAAISPIARRRLSTTLALLAVLPLLACSVLAGEMPERLFPGKFDLIGSSHQIWHVLILALMWLVLHVYTTVFSWTGDEMLYCSGHSVLS